MKILEGLMEGDLAELVLPVISVDEYESKLADNDDVVVLGFFVDDLDPARDLSGFIQKSHIDIIDTDVSPAPSEEGYYVVFVELPRNRKVFEKIINLVDTIQNLTKVEKWQFIPYGSEKMYDLSVDNLKKHIEIRPKSIKKESVMNWFKHSFCNDILIEQSHISISGMTTETYNIVDFGRNEVVKARCGLKNKKYKIDEYSNWKAKKLENILGPNYFVSICENKILVNSVNNGFVLVLEE